MKNKKTKQFKVIPFCISLLIVLLITGGIGIYTTFFYGGTDIKFLNGYLGYEENKDIPSTQEYIEKFVKLESTKYILNTKETGLSYRNPSTKQEYTSKKDDDVSDSNSNYFNNGVMRVYDYFDIILYTTLSETKNSEGEVETTLNYTFYFFNVNYEKLQTQNLSFQIAFVEGIDNRNSLDEYKDGEALVGDLALEKMMADESYGGDTIAIEYNYNYSDKGIDGSLYYLYDMGARFEGTDFVIENGANSLCVYKASLFNSSTYTYEDRDDDNDDKEESVASKDFADMENSTFLIYQLTTDKNGENVAKPIVEGTINNILTVDEANELNLLKGYSNTLYKVPTFIRYTWTNIVVFTGIAFVLSTVIAVLFYFIWVDDKTTSKKKK